MTIQPTPAAPEAAGDATEAGALERAIALLGGPSEAARALGISRQAVHKWKGNRAPVEHCPTIERLTLRAVTCEQLRGDVEWSVVRRRPHKPRDLAAA